MTRLRLLLPLGLLLRVAVCSVNTITQCEMDEFKHENLCCQQCSPGTYLLNPCQENHNKSECAPCDSEHFISQKNKEPRCFPCTECRDDQEEVAKCSRTADRVCQCKQGTYCDSENCLERCHTCSSCPDGRVIRKCNATMDTVCDTFDSKPGQSGSQCFSTPLGIVVIIAAFIIIIGAFIIIIIIIIGAVIIFIRKIRDRRAPNNVNATTSEENIQLCK
ncbi:tumor necrosis factor receptor superfamily member 26-like [Mus pahari]|uniref:tumor necrosis factor receptor superfamily member 26-like n=1 Tax=Mus pahari TaxID=10093 RepID=UPI000A30CB1C|nr:tumor necrosis factor receptor superfamily member 26-like [Mus pahari]